MKLFKSHVFALICLAMAAAGTQARAQETPLPQPEGDLELATIHSRIHELDQQIDGLRQSIEIQLKDESVKFPEYADALNAFYTRSEQATARFHGNLKKIEDLIESTLSREYSELKAVRNLYAQQPSRPTRVLLKEKERRLEIAKASLQKSIQEAYDLAMAGLISNGNLLVFPASHPLNPALALWVLPAAAVAVTGGIFGVVYVALGSSAPGVFVGFLAAILPGIGTVHVLDSFTGIVGDYALGDVEKPATSLYGSEKDNFGQRERLFINPKTFKEDLKKASHRIYGVCKTAGCALLINEYYKNWLVQAAAVNQTIRLVDGLKLKKLKIARLGKQKRRLNKMADMEAKELPIGEFSETKE